MAQEIRNVIEQHADEASFLYRLRKAAIIRPDYSLDDLSDLDTRLFAHLDALLISEISPTVINDTGNLQADDGEAFVEAVLWLSTNSGPRAAMSLSCTDEDFSFFDAIGFALQWAQWNQSYDCLSIVNEEFALPRKLAKLLLIEAGGEPDLDLLIESIRSSNPQVASLATRLTGSLKLRELKKDLEIVLHSEVYENRLWALWAGALLGREFNIGAVLQLISMGDQYKGEICRVVARDILRSGIEGVSDAMIRNVVSHRAALAFYAAVGSVKSIGTIIDAMSRLEHARVAGEAFSMITGVDLAYEDMDADWPEGFEAGPTEDPADENVDLDEDEDLPWPNQALVQEWWDKNKGHFQEGQRYLCGRPITEENCRRVLRDGYQRQRIAAAYELALMNPDEPLFNWKAPGFKQQEWLGLRPSR